MQHPAPRRPTHGSLQSPETRLQPLTPGDIAAIGHASKGFKKEMTASLPTPTWDCWTPRHRAFGTCSVFSITSSPNSSRGALCYSLFSHKANDMHHALVPAPSPTWPALWALIMLHLRPLSHPLFNPSSLYRGRCGAPVLKQSFTGLTRRPCDHPPISSDLHTSPSPSLSPRPQASIPSLVST